MPNFEIYLYMWSILKAYRMLSLTKLKKKTEKLLKFPKLYIYIIGVSVILLYH